MEYIVASDDDGHYYVIPAFHENEWHILIEKCYKDDDYSNFPPTWAHSIDGALSLLKFKEWRIE